MQLVIYFLWLAACIVCFKLGGIRALNKLSEEINSFIGPSSNVHPEVQKGLGFALHLIAKHLTKFL